MANSSFFVSQRAGNWSVHSNIASSPWYGPNYTSLAATPSTATSSADLGYSVQIDHAVTLDVNATVGGSYQSAAFAPPVFSGTDGSSVTSLPTGTYRVAYQLVSGNGSSTAGATESAPVSLITGVSKPRVTFPAAPPAGCSYSLYLTDGSGLSGWERLYCTDITVDLLDLVAGLWGNTFSFAVATGGVLAYSAAKAMTPLRAANAITIGPTGSLTLAANVSLKLRGDLWIVGAPGGSADYLTMGWGSSLAFDSSLAVSPAAANYVLWFANGGRIRLLGPS